MLPHLKALVLRLAKHFTSP